MGCKKPGMTIPGLMQRSKALTPLRWGCEEKLSEIKTRTCMKSEINDVYGAIAKARQALNDALELLDHVESQVEVSELVTKGEAAEMLGCSTHTIYNYLREGKLKVVARGNRTGIRREAIHGILRARGCRS